MRTPEFYEKKDVDSYLKNIGAFVVKPTTGGFGASGAPDRVACISGTFWGIEIKRQGKGPTVLQQARIDAIRAAGGMAVVGTAEMVIAAIEEWRNREVKRCTICGFVVDTRFAAEKPTADFSMRGR